MLQGNSGTNLAIRRMDTSPIELAYCVFTSMWGISMFFSPHLFQNNRSFAALGYLMPQQDWGIFAVGVVALRIYGLWEDVVQARLIAAMLGGMIWTYTWLTMWLLGPFTTGVGTYFGLAVINFFVFVKLCRTYLGAKRCG